MLNCKPFGAYLLMLKIYEFWWLKKRLPYGSSLNCVAFLMTRHFLHLLMISVSFFPQPQSVCFLTSSLRTMQTIRQLFGSVQDCADCLVGIKTLSSPLCSCSNGNGAKCQQMSRCWICYEGVSIAAWWIHNCRFSLSQPVSCTFFTPFPRRLQVFAVIMFFCRSQFDRT